jgi:hypothetical protein
MAKALMLYYSFHEHVEKLEHEIAAGEDRFRKRQIIHSASGSYVRTDEGDVSVKGTGATQMLPRTIDVDGLRVFCP